VEAIVGVILVVIALVEILWIMRTVQRNMPKV
jgi:heme/copper-type cytochrome/quinol oxidase subunit 4